jgi:hypothetical protein
MADIRDLYYHGIRQQIRRVLNKLGPERTEKGLTAFEDGASNWSECFFARALEGECNLGRHGDPSWQIANALEMDTVVPIKIVWHLFDGVGDGKTMSKEELHQFVKAVASENLTEDQQKVEDFLKTIDFSSVA